MKMGHLALTIMATIGAASVAVIWVPTIWHSDRSSAIVVSAVFWDSIISMWRDEIAGWVRP